MANFGIQDFGKNKNEQKKPYCVGKRRQRNSINKKLRTESIKIIYFKTKKKTSTKRYSILIKKDFTYLRNIIIKNLVQELIFLFVHFWFMVKKKVKSVRTAMKTAPPWKKHVANYSIKIIKVFLKSMPKKKNKKLHLPRSRCLHAKEKKSK